MKIRVGVSETKYGYIDIEVPPESPILSPGAAIIKKRRAAHKLAKKAIEGNTASINWMDPDEDPLFAPETHVNHDNTYLIRCPRDRSEDLFDDSPEAQARVDGNERIRQAIAQTVFSRIRDGTWDYAYYDCSGWDKESFMRTVLHRSSRSDDCLQLSVLQYTVQGYIFLCHSDLAGVGDFMWETSHLDAKKLRVGILDKTPVLYGKEGNRWK